MNPKGTGPGGQDPRPEAQGPALDAYQLPGEDQAGVALQACRTPNYALSCIP